MVQMQMLFSGFEKKQLTAKQLRAAITEAVKGHKRYQDIIDNMAIWKEEMKQLVAVVKDDFNTELDVLSSLKNDIRSEREMLCDLALEKLKAGEPLEVEGSDGQKYTPTFTVKFKKFEN